MPFQLAGFRIQRDDRIRIQIVAVALVAEIIRRRVAYAPIQRVGFLVVGAGQPAAAPAGIARIAGPALRIILDRVELP
jgi:hypothetical protein